MLKKLLRLYHTVKYLKFRQIIGRVISLLPRLIRKSETHPPIIEVFRKNHFIPRKEFTKDFQNFTFLSESYNLEEVGWDNHSISKLWRYNLHYFEFLLQDNESKQQQDLQCEIIQSWMDNNQFGVGTGWEPYPTSLRIINWIKWHWQTGKLSHRAKISLWNQVRWLESRPEFHLLGNHLFINAKALLFATVFFDQNSASKIYKTGIKIINQELDEQFLADGAHFELSPMYHSLAMEDLLDLISISENLPCNFPKAQILEKFEKGMQWLQTMIYAKDELSHFNDCANGIAPTFTQLIEFAITLGIDKKNIEVNLFSYHKDSGFLVYRDDKSHLIADIGNVGPDYLPGHAHADTLSFELAVNGYRVIVNSGTSVYGSSKERLRQRGTSAHSTIQIDNEDSSEVWSGFRVARRARPFDIQVKSDFNKTRSFGFTASHDGYKRLKNYPIHTRSINFINNSWEISDEISGNKNGIILRYFIHPDIQIGKNRSNLILSKMGQNIVRFSIVSPAHIEICESTYHDEFGVSKSNKCLQVKMLSPCILKTKIELL